MDEGKGEREREREKKSSSFLSPRLRAGVFLRGDLSICFSRREESDVCAQRMRERERKYGRRRQGGDELGQEARESERERDCMWDCASLSEKCAYVLLVKIRRFPWEADEEKACTRLYLFVDLALQVQQQQ